MAKPKFKSYNQGHKSFPPSLDERSLKTLQPVSLIKLWITWT